MRPGKSKRGSLSCFECRLQGNILFASSGQTHVCAALFLGLSLCWATFWCHFFGCNRTICFRFFVILWRCNYGHEFLAGTRKETLLVAMWVFGHWERQTAGKEMIQPFSAGMDSQWFEVFEKWILGLPLAGDTNKLLKLTPGTENQELDWYYPKAWS